MKPFSVAVLDDHTLIVEAISALIKNEDSLSFAGGFSQSIELFNFLTKKSSLDILLLDIQLKDEDGLKICQELKKTYPHLKIIMLSSITQVAVVMDALKKGANGYLPKNISKEDLKNACRDVINGKTYVHKEISFIPTENNSTQNEYIPKLTRREKEILKLILEEMTTSEISSKLNITTSTIETHRSSLLNKTGSKNVVGLIKFTLEKGLLENDL